MSIYDWEPEIEFIDLSREHLAQPVPRKFVEVSLVPMEQDMSLNYDASDQRHVRLVVLGFTAVAPIVKTTVRDGHRVRNFSPAPLVGCKHPTENILFPGVIRTFHLPIVSGPELHLILPMPRDALRIT
jgi:hypothetical protein